MNLESIYFSDVDFDETKEQ